MENLKIPDKQTQFLRLLYIFLDWSYFPGHAESFFNCLLSVLIYMLSTYSTMIMALVLINILITSEGVINEAEKQHVWVLKIKLKQLNNYKNQT